MKRGAKMTTAISVQIDKKDKEQVTKILQQLGISMSGLINMTIKQVIMRKRIPFDIAIPDDELKQYFTNKEIEKAANELKYMENHLDEYKSYDNVNDLFKDLDND